MQIEPVQIGRARASVTAILETGLKFGEGTHAGTEVEIRRKQVALQKITVFVFRSRSEVGLIEQFIPLAYLSTDCRVPVLAAERHVFQPVQPIGGLGSVGQKTPVLVVPEWLKSRPRGGRLWRLLSEGQHRRAKTQDK